MAESGKVNVVNTDIGCSDHFLVWMELGVVAKCKKRSKRVIRRWRLDRFQNDEIKHHYQSALRAEVDGFRESIKCKIEEGLRGHDLEMKCCVNGKALLVKWLRGRLGKR